MAETLPKIENVDTYQRLGSQLYVAEEAFDAAKLDVMNQMADTIVENGNMTVDINEFMLAMHGVHRYQSRFARHWEHKELPKHSDKTHRLYDKLERSVEGVAGQVMMNNNSLFDGFAKAPIHIDNRINTTYSPLRFVIEHRPKSYGRSASYLGSVMLPVSRLRDNDWDPIRGLDAISVARFLRPKDEDWTETVTGHDQYPFESWHVGKKAIVGAGIKDYRTTTEHDKTFLDRFEKASDELHELLKDSDESSWAHVWAKPFEFTGFGD